MTAQQLLGLASDGYAPMLGASFLPAHGMRIPVDVAPILSTSGFDGVVTSLSVGWQYLRD